MPSQPRKRSRSVSSYTSDSVSTISTNLSISPKRARRDSDGYVTSQKEHLDLRSHSNERKRRYRSSSAASGSSSDHSLRRGEAERNRRRRHRTLTPESRGRPSWDRRGSRRSRSRSESVDKSRVARERKSMTPSVMISHSRGNLGDGSKDSQGIRDNGGGPNLAQRESVSQRKQYRSARKERSLSPYSRRLALTQSMNMVR